MAVSYKKLWKILIDRDMKKKDLCAAAGISHASMAKLGKNENVTTDVLLLFFLQLADRSFIIAKGVFISSSSLKLF